MEDLFPFPNLHSTVDVAADLLLESKNNLPTERLNLAIDGDIGPQPIISQKSKGEIFLADEESQGTQGKSLGDPVGIQPISIG